MHCASLFVIFLEWKWCIIARGVNNLTILSVNLSEVTFTVGVDYIQR